MIERCYSKRCQQKHPSYKGCEVVSEWHNFQNSAQWYDDNIYVCGNERMDLDKDILIKGNKIYSPETCIFVPQRINSLFAKRQNDRGKYPIGVCYNKLLNKYISSMNINNDNIHLGCYNTPEEAFYAYKKAKEKYIKEVADEYKEKYPQFPKKLYDALYVYEVEIND